MDKDRFNKSAIHLYQADIRAVIRDENKLFTDLNDPQRVGWTGHHFLWKILRAYQDEQRKKGVPINIYYGNGGKEWLDLSTPEYRFVYTVNGGRPSIEIPVPSVLVGGLQAHQKVFTNFRWREGYPKGKIRIGPDKLEISNVTVINPIKPGWGQEIRDKSGIQDKLVDGEWINVYGKEGNVNE